MCYCCFEQTYFIYEYVKLYGRKLIFCIVRVNYIQIMNPSKIHDSSRSYYASSVKNTGRPNNYDNISDLMPNIPLKNIMDYLDLI